VLLLLFMYQTAYFWPALQLPVVEGGGAAVAVSIALMFYGMFGLLFLYFGLRGPVFSVRLDDAGLSGGIGPSAIVLLDEVSEVVAVTRHGTPTQYQVLDARGQKRISWFAASRFMKMRPTRHAQAITPKELAALVARRSGKPLVSREEER
jgi:hypothetical protein